MDKVVGPYRRQVEMQRENQNAPIHDSQGTEEEFLTYILRPMNLNLMYEHQSEGSDKSMKVSIKLDSLQLALQH